MEYGKTMCRGDQNKIKANKLLLLVILYFANKTINYLSGQKLTVVNGVNKIFIYFEYKCITFI